MNIVQFAKISGLSTATVSRAFSQPDKVRKATLDHVMELADRLHYYPHPSGRTLVRGRYDTLGLVWPLEIEGAAAPLPHRVLVALTQHLIKNDLDLLICPVQREQPAGVRHAELSFRRSRCDAWILLYPQTDDVLIKPLRMAHKPVVAVMGPVQECPDWKSVQLNQQMWIEDALKRLRANEAKKVLFVGCRPRSPDHQERLDQFGKLAPKYFGENYRALPIWPVEAAPIRELLLAEHFDAIMGVDDTAALVGMAACQQVNLRIPEDVQIVGIDSRPEAAASNPALTTYRQPLEEMTAHAVELALGRGNPFETFNPVFVPRGTLRSQ